MTRRFLSTFFFPIVILGICSCAVRAVPTKTIYVGVTPMYPPIIYKMDGKITGLEIDLAARLADELKRPVECIEVSWEKQIPTLLERKTDIIMSGMSVTKARQVRITFSEPYLKSGLMIAFTAENAPQYTSLRNIRESVPTVGFVAGTTGEVYARNTFREENRMVPIQTVEQAALELKNKSVDIFIYDAPAIMWIVSENEAELKFLPELLDTDYLAWGLRQDNQELLGIVNGVLSRWKNDGSLKAMILKRLPYWKFF